MRAVAYLFGLVGIGGILALGQVVIPGVVVPLGFSMFAALLLGGRTWVPKGYMTALGAGVLALWFMGASRSAGDNVAYITRPFLPLMRQGTLFFFVACLLWAAISLRRAEKPAMRALPALLLAFVLTLLVANLSGDAGGASPMHEWFMRAFGLSKPSAEVVVLLLRKTIHFTFYATVGFAGAAAARSGGEELPRARWIGLGYALLLATFDEVRQTGAATRTGSPFDVGLDMLGALMGTAIALRAVPKRASPKAKQS